MRLLAVIFCLSFISLITDVFVAHAQQPDSINAQIVNVPPSSFNTYFVGFEYAFSGISIRFIGKTLSADFQLHRLYGGKKVFRHPENLFSIYYTVSANFISKLNYTVKDTKERRKRFGLGISPAGYTFLIPVSKSISATAGFSGGFSIFDKYFPDKRGILLNFTYSVNSALLVRIHQESWFTLRVHFYHHSNAEIGEVNPGLDLIMLSAGFQAQF